MSSNCGHKNRGGTECRMSGAFSNFLASREVQGFGNVRLLANATSAKSCRLQENKE